MERSLSGESRDVSTFLLFCACVLTAIGVVGALMGATTHGEGESAVRAGRGGGSRQIGVVWACFSSNSRLLRLFRLRLLGRMFFCVGLETALDVGVAPDSRVTTPRALQRKKMVSTPPLHSSTHFAHSPLSRHWRYSSSTVARVEGGGVAVLVCCWAVILSFGLRPLEATQSPTHYARAEVH